MENDVIKYKCPECDWIGTEGEMGADCTETAWSNWICPKCGYWNDLEDYEIVECGPQ